MCVCLRRPEEGDRVPEAEVTGCPELPGIGAGGGGSNLGPPEEQQMLTVEPSLQPHRQYSYNLLI